MFPSLTRHNADRGCWQYGAKSKVKELLKEGFPPIAIRDLGEIGGTDVLINALTEGNMSILKLNCEKIDYYEMVLRDWGGNLNVVRPMTIHGSKGLECDIGILLTDIAKVVHHAERHT